MSNRTKIMVKIFSRTIRVSAGLFIVLGIAFSRTLPEDGPSSTAEGAYTEAQAKRGERVQRRVCVRCHIPAYYKGGLLDSWTGNTVGALNSQISNTMPEDRPSSLKPQQYADLMAYILMLNGFPAGDTELPSEDAALARIIIERKK